MDPQMEMVQTAFATPEKRTRLATEKQDKELRQVREAASRSHYRERQRFEHFISDLLAGGLGRRKVGAVFVALGITLCTIGSVLSA